MEPSDPHALHTLQMLDYKVGIIGFGTMAQGIVQGWRGHSSTRNLTISACAAHWDKLVDNAAKYDVTPMRTAEDVVRSSDIIIVAVKPYQIADIVANLSSDRAASSAPSALEARSVSSDSADIDWSSKLVVSVAAGKLNDFYNDILPADAHHISSIPNTPISIGRGVVIAEDAHTLTDDQLVLFHKLFDPIATVEFVDSAHVSIAGTIAGCGPAYAAMFIEALADAGVKYGLTRATAYRLASAMVSGTGALQLATGQDPAHMKDAVCSPGGTTIQGVCVLEKHGFRGSIISAVDAVEKSR